MSRIYSVSQINSYIKHMFTQDFLLQRIAVGGEVSNCTYHRSGHLYFTLKDASSAISCVMFSSARSGLDFRMQEGDRVVVTGAVDVFERDGRYQFYARKIEREGAGELFERFLRLKQELEEMGLFDPMYKQPIPEYVRRLGIVTAPTGAAIQDIRKVAGRRNPYVQLVLYPALVQGEGAAASIVRGIETLDEMGLDCIIVGRGGGSIEDLWAFNEEAVARAIFSCGTPVISAVGHETDTTISDFVADLRAPTPSAAAELAVADVFALLQRLERMERRIEMGMAGQVQHAQDQLQRRKTRWMYLSPQRQTEERRRRIRELREMMNRQLEQTIRRDREHLQSLHDRLPDQLQRTLERDRQRLVRYGEQLPARMERIVTDRRHRLQLQISRFEGLSPLARLNQGYARVEDAAGHAITSAAEAAPGDPLQIYVRDGRIRGRVESSEAVEWTSGR